MGSDHVLLESEALARHSRDTIPWQRTCSAVVRPASRDEVCAVVKIAARHRLPVWTFSKGKNWGYGATMAAQDGAVILLLERMNRILEVNEDLAYAVIEPGVTYGQLADHQKSRAIKLWADCTDSTPEGSVLGNALDRGLGHTPYGDHFGNLCGLEVVLASGEVVRTGAAPPGSPTWHTFKWGTGPYLEGLFSQSNFGIVTRAGIWLMPEPEAFEAFVCEIEREESLPAVLDSLRRLAFAGALRGTAHLINDVLCLSMLTQYPHELRQGQPCLPDDARRELRSRHGISPWSLTSGLYGTIAQVRANRALIRRALKPHGRLTFIDRRELGRLESLIRLVRRVQRLPFGTGLGRLLKNCLIGREPLETLELVRHAVALLQGVPGEFIVRFAYFKSRQSRPSSDVNPARDGCGLIWFAPVSPLTGTHVTRVLDLCRPVFRDHGFDFSVSLIVVNPRSAVALMEIFYDKADPAETARAGALYDDLCGLTTRAGYQQYRTNVAHMHRLLEPVPEYKRLLDSMKGAVDPCSTLAPGRYGVGSP
ncbi:MAG TPA: FAD-binding oxidoreductase [Gemmataceae bacterium]|nr:FAD-binding oxidoreductase [Gemmataceae bacterium]